jgi:cyclic pyranopterin phosphate synthase
MTTEHPMIDPFGRHITYLRVSVTDRCDFRCVYCMAETMTFLPRQEVLTLEEIDRLGSAFIAKGVRKLQLTGGEPLDDTRDEGLEIAATLIRSIADT